MGLALLMYNKCNKYSAELVSKYSSVTDVLIADIEKILEKSRPKSLYENQSCIDIIRETIEKTGHVARARSVAYMAALCRYLARLVEAYGVRTSYSGVIPGKGMNIHKILAIATQILFEKFPFKSAGINIRNEIARSVREATYIVTGFDLMEGTDHILKRAIDSAPTEVHKELFKRQQDEIKKDINMKAREALEMLDRLVNFLQNIVWPKTGLSLERLNPLTETQFVDYTFHIIGTPDLVLEDEDTRRAIVVEWKTYGDPSSVPYWEMAQAYVYSLIELRRLGYGKSLRIISGREFRDFINAFTETDPKKAAVIPVIMRPGRQKHHYGYYTTHPALAQPNIKKADLCAVFSLLTLSALHLTMLLAYIDKDKSEICKINPKDLGLSKVKAEKIAAYRLTPLTLTDTKLRELARFPRPYAGNPARQEKYPCTYCKKVFKAIPPACRTYFAKSELTPLEKTIYSMRNIILKEHENDMRIYRELYRIGIKHLEEHEKKHRNYIDINGSKFYFNIFDEISLEADFIDDNGYSILDNVYSIELVKYDSEKLRETMYIIGLDDNNLAHVYNMLTIREGKPVAIYLIDTKIRYIRPIPLNIGIFARTDNIEIEKDNIIRVTLGIPSVSLRFSTQLFAYILRRIGCKLDNEHRIGRINCDKNILEKKGIKVLAVETNVDLTHYDLRILDLMYRGMLIESEDIMTEKEEFEKSRKDLEKYIDIIFKELSETFLNKW